MRKCSKCSHAKPITDFYKQKGTSDGYRKVCKACQYNRRPRKNIKTPIEAVFNTLYRSYKHSARFREIEFSIDYDSFCQLVLEPCYHCGNNPEPYNPYISGSHAVSETRKREAWIVKNGIDRLDNNRGYVKDNCVPCCSTCNYSRQDSTVSAWVEHCQRIVNHHRSKNNVKA